MLNHTAQHVATAAPATQAHLPIAATGSAWPSVSVIMPCYNAARTIAGSIASVLEQDYPGPLELIVVDDGSADDSVCVARAMSGVRVLQQANQGPAAARNLGLRAATGEVYAFLDADDEWLVGSLRVRVSALLEHDEVDIVFGSFMRWTPALDSEATAHEEPDSMAPFVREAVRTGWLYPELLLSPILHIIATIARRRVFDTIGCFDPQLRVGEDYEFWIRAAQQFRFLYLPQPVARYRLHAASTTYKPRADNLEHEVVLRSLHLYGSAGPDGRRIDRRQLAEGSTQLCYDHAYLHYWRGDSRIALRGFVRAILHGPLRVKAWAYLPLSLFKALRRSGDPKLRDVPSSP